MKGYNIANAGDGEVLELETLMRPVGRSKRRRYYSRIPWNLISDLHEKKEKLSEEAGIDINLK